MKQFLADLFKKWWSDPLPKILPRDVQILPYFDPNINRGTVFFQKMRKVISVTGFRRTGKTFLLLDFAQKIGREKCVYINFEDERIPKKTEILSSLIDLLTELKGDKRFVLLMDEIQEIPDWSTWARRINETTKHQLILSGSSSKLSSKEIPTQLRGQTITLPVFPLNWNEFLQFKGTDKNLLPHAELLNLLREYLTYGGLPEIVMAEEGLRPLILTEYFSTFVDRDIVERYNLRKKEVFSDLLRLLPNYQSFTYSKLTNSLKSVGHNVGKSTVIRYMRWLEGSYFHAKVEILSANIRTRMQTVKKSYLIDNYFTSHLSSRLSDNLGHLMEQTVFHKLNIQSVRDPRYEVAYWKDFAGNEVDFVVSYNKTVHQLIQVTYADNLADIPERETKALIKAAKTLNISQGMLITWGIEDTKTIDGITIIFTPLWKWLEKETN